ncbi:GCN5-like N-acetyltransferase [Actinomycetospora sp. NBRC 106375]|uniref:GNAT family N-acetyltransferase n=1 Tax=Actinomycetospora sp. NBRC 106375 TaxID=3032207 RepID=UPI0024A252F1|nr:GNAT family N-acetyltransferase [Actinomycetospora sp. NBRC 106375]GLZ45934.1 GCN5-like N-acetyltransferase [Actinomycetospora sp. NBRC 106375]
MTTFRPRPAERRDVGAISVVLARAFQDDPVYRFAIPDPRRRAQVLPGLMRTMVTVMHAGMGPTEVVDVDGHVVGAAAWDDPGAVEPGPWRSARALPGLVRAVGSRLTAFGELGAALEHARPTTPHRYLFHLGTDPGWWGHGVGTALLRPALAGADARGETVYLETRPENVGYYERFGFAVAGEIPSSPVPLVGMSR